MQGQQNITSRILQFRNGIYQGQTKGNKRHGYGILITDQNIIIISEWKNDMLSGWGFIFLDPENYGFGEFNRGQIEGGFLWRQYGGSGISKGRTLFSEFNKSKPINKMVLIDYDQQKLQTIVHKSPIYQVVGQKKLELNNQDEEILKAINYKFPCLSVIDYLDKYFCHSQPSSVHSQPPFKLKPLNNRNILFYFDDKSNPTSIGICLNKNQQLISWGMYTNDKLSGFGCKYENSVRYEGIFEAGFINGIGLKYNQGKYSFGSFDNGNLVEMIYVDDRSNASEEKLMQFKKDMHIRSIWYENSFVRKNIVKYKGFSELVFEIDSQQQYMYPQIVNIVTGSTAKKPQQVTNLLNKTASKNLNNSTITSNPGNFNNSINKNLALNMLIKRQGEKLETKSSKQFLVRDTGGMEKDKPNLDGPNIRNFGNIAHETVSKESRQMREPYDTGFQSKSNHNYSNFNTGFNTNINPTQSPQMQKKSQIPLNRAQMSASYNITSPKAKPGPTQGNLPANNKVNLRISANNTEGYNYNNPYRNPELEQDIDDEQIDTRSNGGLRGLRKFNYPNGPTGNLGASRNSRETNRNNYA